MFSSARNAAKAASSKDPRVVADSLGIMVVDLYGSICGYAAVYRSGKSSWPVIGLHRDLSSPWDLFGGWHELAHVLRGHVYDPSFANRHCDCAFFNQEVDARTISLQEREANLISADLCIEDDPEAETFGMEIPEEMGMLRDHTVTEEDLSRGPTLRDLHLPHGIRVVMVRRKEKFIVPHGSLELKVGDDLVIIMGDTED